MGRGRIKGYKHSEESKKKMRLATVGRIPPSRKGVTLSKETRFKMGLSHKGEKCYNWKGGIASNERIRGSFKYRQWRSDVFIRDNFACQKCGAKNGNGKSINLEAHHKIPFHKLIQEVKEYLPLFEIYDGAMAYTPLWEVDNGITYCKDCHRKVERELKIKKQ